MQTSLFVMANISIREFPSRDNSLSTFLNIR